MGSEGSLPSLSEVCLVKILDFLPRGDKLRLSRVCRDFHVLWRRTVRSVCISQQDLELYDDQPIVAFNTFRSLRAANIDLDGECASFLAATPQLQQLTSITITDPVQLNGEGLRSILAACSLLISLHIDGNCADAADSSGFCGFDVPQQRPHRLQQLALVHNSFLSVQQLFSFLGADHMSQHPANGLHCTSCSLQCCSNSSSQGNLQIQQLLATEAAADGIQLPMLLPAWPHLHTLNLSGCSKLGGSWAFLALVPELHTLQLHSCYKVTNTTVRAFSKAVISSANSSSSHTHTCTIRSGGIPTDSTVAASSGLHNPCTVPGAARGFLLRTLDLSYTRVTDGVMCHLATALPQLQWLSLKGCNVGDDGLLQLLQLQQLTALLIKHCHRVTEEGVQQLAPLSNLCELSFGYTSLPEADEVAAAIASQFKQLTALDLLSSELTDIGLAALGSLPQLQHLKLYQAGVTVDALRHFGEQASGQQLTGLVLYGLGGLSQLECLSSLTALLDLQLGGLCHLADVPESIKQLAVLPNLRHLTLERIDDITVGCLEYVLAHVDLHSLKVRGCDGVSQEEMELLSAVCAERCGSSASIFWVSSPSCDTDDEDDGWQMLPA